ELAERRLEIERLNNDLAATREDRDRTAARLAEEWLEVRTELQEVSSEVGVLREVMQERNQGVIRRTTRRMGDGRRSASQLLSWILVRPSKERRGYVSTYRALRRSGEFDADYYRSRYPDVRRARVNPLMHYVEQGAGEGRDPNASFSTTRYLAANPDVRQTGANPLLHWLREGTKPAPTPRPLTAEPERRAVAPAARPRVGAGGEDIKGYREFVAQAIPTGALTLVASDGDPELLRLSGPEARSFPDGDGVGDAESVGSTAAVAQLEWLRTKGVHYLVLPEIARRWWASVPEFNHYLNRHYPRAGAGEHGVIARLDSSRTGTRPWQARVEARLEEYRARFRDPPSILDLTSEGTKVASSFPELTVVTPVGGDGPLAYLDDSVDLVIVGGRGGDQLGEGRRVASNAVIDLDQTADPGAAAIEWLSEPVRTLPAISIVVPTYDAAELLDTCLQALLETLPAHLHVEVLVVDDGSSDSTPDLLTTWEGGDDRVRRVRN